MSNFFSDEENYPSIKSDTMDNQDAGDPESSPRQQTIRECVSSSLSDYLSRVDPDNVSNLYELVLSEVEAPLLETVMQYTRSNQSKATIMLGLNRGTLRKKLKKYGMLN